MPEVILADSRMETMEGYYPGRKPVGNVKIDWDHPLTRGLRAFFLFGETPIDIVNDIGGERYDSPVTHSTEGSSNYTQNAITSYVSFQDDDRYTFGSYTVWGSAKMSILTKINCIDGFTLGKYLNESPFLGEYSFSGTVGSTFSFQCLDNASTIRIKATTTANLPAGWSTFAATSDGAWVDEAITLYRDGIEQSVTLAGQDSNYSGMVNRGSPVEFGVGLRESGSFSSSKEMELPYAMFYEIALTPEEVASLTRNPYQFLIPAG